MVRLPTVIGMSHQEPAMVALRDEFQQKLGTAVTLEESEGRGVGRPGHDMVPRLGGAGKALEPGLDLGHMQGDVRTHGGRHEDM